MSTPSLPVLDPTAAAIDVGSEQLHLSIAGGPPKVFGTTTGQLYELRDWLLAHGVKSVAMEATGIYWLCPYEVLEKGPGSGDGQWQVRQKPARSQVGHEGLPMAGDFACSRTAQAGLCSAGAHPPLAGLPAPAHRSHHDGRQSRTAYAKGPGTDESEDSRRHQRPDRSQRFENDPGHVGRRAQSGRLAGAVRCADSEEQGWGLAPGTGRNLEGRTSVCPAPGIRAVAVLSEEDRRVRPGHRNGAPRVGRTGGSEKSGSPRDQAGRRQWAADRRFARPVVALVRGQGPDHAAGSRRLRVAATAERSGHRSSQA